MKLRAVLIVGIPLVVAAYVVWTLNRDVLLDKDLTIEERFKYGSIGSEPGGSILRPIGGLLPPAPIFKILPAMCSDLYPEPERITSYEDFGLIYEENPDGKKKPLPIGISHRQRLGMEMIGVNCALCHAGTVHETPDAKVRFIAGMPPQQVNVQRLFRFIWDCIQSDRFDVRNVIDHIQASEGRTLTPAERARYRILIPRIRGQVRDAEAKIGVLTRDRVVASGPGRLDTINPGKALEVGWSLDALLNGRNEELIATADFPPVWNLALRDKPNFRLHWDGNIGSVKEVLSSAALAVGAKPQTLDQRRFDELVAYLNRLEAPSYPARFPRNQELVARGKDVFNEKCARCHESDAGKLTANAELRADVHRLNAFSQEFAAILPVALNHNYARSRFKFTTLQKTHGYANVPLDGVWARAPYLHNGSVPTLRDLLQPARCRPPKFHRGSDVFDPENVGFVSYAEAPSATDCPHRPGPTFADAPTMRPRLFVFDTSVPGNHNTGHDGADFGTTLTPEQKKQLLEYLKDYKPT